MLLLLWILASVLFSSLAYTAPIEEASNPRPKDVLKRLRGHVHELLLSQFKKSFNDYRHIQWTSVDLIGWPKGVLFYTSSYWTAEDCQSLLAAMPAIQFLPKANRRTDTEVPEAKKAVLKERLKELSRVHFHCKCIDWRGIKALCPDLHLTKRNVEAFIIDDYEKMEAALETMEAKFNLKFAGKVVDALDENLEASVFFHLFSKYQELFPKDSFIDWNKIEVSGWPREVIYYSEDCWTTADCLSLHDSLPNIQFAIAPTAEACAVDLKIFSERVDEFFLNHFMTWRPDWKLIAEQVVGFHLSHQTSSKWTSKDVVAIENALNLIEDGNSSKSLLVKRKAFPEENTSKYLKEH